MSHPRSPRKNVHVGTSRQTRQAVLNATPAITFDGRKRSAATTPRLGFHLVDVTIRPATDDDVEALLDLTEKVAGEGRYIGTEAPIDRAARGTRLRDVYIAGDNAEIFVAEADEAIVGSADVDMTGARGLAHLGMLVAADRRGQGIGTRLLETAIAWARAAGAHKLVLEVWPHNDAARALYRKFGFEEEGYLRKHYRRRNGELWDAVVMGLLLTDEHPGD